MNGGILKAAALALLLFALYVLVRIGPLHLARNLALV